MYRVRVHMHIKVAAALGQASSWPRKAEEAQDETGGVGSGRRMSPNVVYLLEQASFQNQEGADAIMR